MKAIAVLCSQGDMRLTWNPEKADEVAAARAEVERLRVAGYSFFVVDGSPADEVAAGQGELVMRRVRDDEDPLEAVAAAPAVPPSRRGRGRHGATPAVAVPPMRGG